jgi:hypothetical protein
MEDYFYTADDLNETGIFCIFFNLFRNEYLFILKFSRGDISKVPYYNCLIFYLVCRIISVANLFPSTIIASCLLFSEK